MANPAQRAKNFRNMPVCVDVMKFKSKVSDDTLRLIASGGIHRVGSPFARFFGIAHAAVVSRFSPVLAIHRPVARKTVAARCGNAIGAPSVRRGSGSHGVGSPSVSAANDSHSILAGSCEKHFV